jgi:predicted CXXCH cytochrome family protein
MLFGASLSGECLANTIIGSKHDLSQSGEGPIKSESSVIICYFCHGVHTPESQAVLGGYPMWNRDTSELGPYTVYASDTLDSALDQPTAETLACLSCHDGTVALSKIKSGSIGVDLDPPTLAGRSSDLTEDLSGDHPTSFAYDHQVDNELRTIEEAKSDGIKFFGEPSIRLECASCHNPHDPEYRPFLRVSNNASSLCLACHSK